MQYTDVPPSGIIDLDLAMQFIPGIDTPPVLTAPSPFAMDEPKILAEVEERGLRNRPPAHKGSYSAASFSASAAAWNSATFASTSPTMCSTMPPLSIVWSVLPAA